MKKPSQLISWRETLGTDYFKPLKTIKKHMKTYFLYMMQKKQPPFEASLWKKNGAYLLPPLPTKFRFYRRPSLRCLRREKGKERRRAKAIFKGKMWVPLGEYPTNCVLDIPSYCPIEAIYIRYMVVYMVRVLSQGYPPFPLDISTNGKPPELSERFGTVEFWGWSFWMFLAS